MEIIINKIFDFLSKHYIKITIGLFTADYIIYWIFNNLLTL